MEIKRHLCHECYDASEPDEYNMCFCRKFRKHVYSNSIGCKEWNNTPLF